MRCSSIGPRRRLRRMSSTMDNSRFQPCSQLHGDSLNPSKRAEQTTEQKAEQNRRTDTNNAERLDEIEIASSGLDPSFWWKGQLTPRIFDLSILRPRRGSLCSGSHNTHPFGILNSQKGFGLGWKILSGNVRLKPLSGSNSVPEESPRNQRSISSRVFDQTKR